MNRPSSAINISVWVAQVYKGLYTVLKSVYCRLFVINVQSVVIMPCLKGRGPYKRLSKFERCLIIDIRESGHLFRKIAAHSGHNAATVNHAWSAIRYHTRFYLL